VAGASGRQEAGRSGGGGGEEEEDEGVGVGGGERMRVDKAPLPMSV